METALVVLVPEAERLVANYRRRYTHDGADGMPAHVTLLHPFMDTSRLDAGVEDELERLFGGRPTVPLVLREADRWTDGESLLYLRPEPAEPFTAMIEALAGAFPDYPPYGGIHDEIVPHLTVAQGASALLDRIERELTGALPIESPIETAWLCEHAPEGWRRRRAFQLGSAPDR
ncbi:MAG: 2'-5' RNA ligase family protein [Actinomycetota bacterium]|nr:2'-5' RNA ligase family protein [Actinomycetota bacterium]